MTPEQIREAVELAEGFEIRLWHDNGLRLILPGDDYGSTTVVCGDTFENAPKWWFAALASQLISQVDATGHYLAANPLSKDEGGTGTDWWCCVNERGTHRSVGPCTDGGNRDENSILACTEFLRGRK